MLAGTSLGRDIDTGGLGARGEDARCCLREAAGALQLPSRDGQRNSTIARCVAAQVRC
jgi:hypothetical protein